MSVGERGEQIPSNGSTQDKMVLTNHKFRDTPTFIYNHDWSIQCVNQ